MPRRRRCSAPSRVRQSSLRPGTGGASPRSPRWLSLRSLPSAGGSRTRRGLSPTWRSWLCRLLRRRAAAGGPLGAPRWPPGTRDGGRGGAAAQVRGAAGGRAAAGRGAGGPHHVGTGHVGGQARLPREGPKGEHDQAAGPGHPGAPPMADAGLRSPLVARPRGLGCLPGVPGGGALRPHRLRQRLGGRGPDRGDRGVPGASAVRTASSVHGRCGGARAGRLSGGAQGAQAGEDALRKGHLLLGAKGSRCGVTPLREALRLAQAGQALGVAAVRRLPLGRHYHCED